MNAESKHTHYDVFCSVVLTSIYIIHLCVKYYVYEISIHFNGVSLFYTEPACIEIEECKTQRREKTKERNRGKARARTSPDVGSVRTPAPHVCFT